MTILTLPDEELARRMRFSQGPEFLKLSEMLHSDVKAARALRKENEFLEKYPGLPRTAEFAAKVRAMLLKNNLDWTIENLERVTEEIL